MKSLSSLFLLFMAGCYVSKKEETPPHIEDDKKIILEEKPVETIEKLMPQVSGIGEVTNGQFTTYCAGVWIDKSLMLTAAHCISNGENSEVKIINYEESLSPQTFYKGNVIKIDKARDLSLIQCDVGNHSIAKIAAEKDKVGTKLHIIGHTKGLNWSYINGWVSAYRFTKAKNGNRIFTQVTAPIYYGDSGGGVFNEKGELMGITSFIYSIPNVAFAVTLNDINDLLKENKINIKND